MTQTYIRIFLIIAVIVASSACYIFGYKNQPPNTLYTGLRSLNASDHNIHLSFIDQCRKGHFFIQNRYTSEPHSGFLLRPIYFILSTPFRFAHWSNSVVFHIIRIICGILLLIVLFELFRSYELDHRTQIIAFLLIALCSGVGIITKQWLPETADLNVPESILFLSLGEAPHFVFSLLFLWAGLTFLYLSTVQHSYRFLIGFFLCLFILWWEHPFDAVIMIFVAIANLLSFKQLRSKIMILAGIGMLSVGPFLYYLKLKSLPAFAGWASSQNLMTSPSPLAVVSSLFPLLILAIVGLVSVWSDQNKRKMIVFVSIWAATQLVLIYLPFPFQRRLISGIQFPLVILASFYLRKHSNLIVTFVILICSLTNIHITKQFITELRSNAMPFYLPVSYKQAFDWLALQNDDGAVLSEFVTGNFLPAYSGHPSFMGHSSLTPNILQKRAEAARFYRNPEIDLLRQNHIRYVFWGNEEKNKSGGKMNVNWPAVYEAGNIVIFKPPQ